jgi:hypothetical protein
MQITSALVRKAMNESADPWRVGNEALYDLCRKHPSHTDSAAVIGKMWVIGRTYAAAVERRKMSRGGSETLGDRFYIQEVAPTIARSDLDRRLKNLQQVKDPDQRWHNMLAVHKYLVDVLRSLTGLEKRSLASKYLHFHQPSTFYIFDDRAKRAIRRICWSTKLQLQPVPPSVDAQYGHFVVRALALCDHVSREHGRGMSPRQLDRLLLAVADRMPPKSRS